MLGAQGREQLLSIGRSAPVNEGRAFLVSIIQRVNVTCVTPLGEEVASTS